MNPNDLPSTAARLSALGFPVWHGCYDSSWGPFLVPEAFAHPAKVAHGLAERIYRHLLERGYVEPGALVVDPFGGICGFAFHAMVNGLQWVGCELEPRFCTLAQANLDFWLKRWGLTGGRIFQGDSRRLCEVLDASGVAACVGSPPYAEQVVRKRDVDNLTDVPITAQTNWGRSHGTHYAGGYGHTPGQLAALPAGSVGAVVSSPPYASGTVHDGNTIDPALLTGNRPGPNSQARTMDAYGTTPGNIANLPPGDVAAVVSSPPYEGSVNAESHGIDWSKAGPATGNRKRQGSKCDETLRAQLSYGDTDGQLGKEHGTTFWSAAREIVAQCHAILRPGGVAVWVAKDFIRRKARVPFSADWARLCEACGFELVEWIHASLVKEESHPGLFGEEVTKRKERKSFFRRLAEKRGSPAIDHEDVLILRKPQ